MSNVSEIGRDGLNQTGYLALECLDGSARSVVFLGRVFGTFTESDNIIIDLRNCGGGHTNDFFSLPHKLGASISVGRTYDHRTGKDWQGIGVVPDAELEPDHELFAALTSFTKKFRQT